MAGPVPASHAVPLVLSFPNAHRRPGVDGRKSAFADFRSYRPKSETSDFGDKPGHDEWLGTAATLASAAALSFLSAL